MPLRPPLALDPAPPAALALWLRAAAGPSAVATALSAARLPAGVLLGLGRPLIDQVAGPHVIPALQSMRDRGGEGGAPLCPADQGELWLLAHGDDPGAALLLARAALAALGPSFTLVAERSLYRHREGRDLSGYVDGTENPTGEDAVEVAIIAEGPLAGSTFAAVQPWAHALDRLARHAPAARDALIGRRAEDDVELEDAPPQAHVRRTAQEDFAPPTFLLRRSMPFGGLAQHGLLFISFSADAGAFDRVFGRMLGDDDGVVDAIFAFSAVIGGGHYWCPAVDEDGRLVLDALHAPAR